MKEFNLQHTLTSGQIFRYVFTENGAYVAHMNEAFFINEQGVSNHPNKKWFDHFIRADQEELEHEHSYVQEALEHTKGLRILRQHPWECLLAFVISQNNNQKRIEQNMQSLSRLSGEEITHGLYRMPLPKELPPEEELRKIGLGYRARAISELKNIDLEWLYGLADKSYEQAKKELQQLRGIGPKVADCILLFSLGFDEACPEDVWIKRIFTEHNITREELGAKAGLYQQALFHYSRTKK